MEDWLNQLQRELELEVKIDTKAILDAARIAAHTIERPAAPVTTFLMGVAFAQGRSTQDSVDVIEKLAESWIKRDE